MEQLRAWSKYSLSINAEGLTLFIGTELCDAVTLF